MSSVLLQLRTCQSTWIGLTSIHPKASICPKQYFNLVFQLYLGSVHTIFIHNLFNKLESQFLMSVLEGKYQLLSLHRIYDKVFQESADQLSTLKLDSCMQIIKYFSTTLKYLLLSDKTSLSKQNGVRGRKKFPQNLYRVVG